MKKVLLHISIIFISLNMFAQQKNLSNLYTNNFEIINPAFSAVSDYNAAFLNHRNQWTSLDDNPTTTFLSGNYSINKNSGIGGNAYLDQIGIMRHIYAMGNFSQAIRINKHHISFGIGLGIQQSRINLSEVIAEDYTDDIFSNNGGSTGMTYLTDLGIVYKNSNFKIGVSSPSIIQSSLKSSNTVYGLKRQINIISSYDIKFNDKFTLVPGVLYRSLDFNSNLVDFNLDLNWGKTVMIGAGYRSSSSLLARVNGRVNNKIDLGYSIESSFKNGGNNFISHEISLAYKIYKEKEDNILPTLIYDTTKTIINDSVSLVFKDENDSIKKFKFVNIEELRDFTLKHKTKDYTIDYLVNKQIDEDPELNVFNLLLAQDSLFTVEVEDSTGHIKKHRFITLQELHDFNYKLSRENPILSAKLKKEIDIHPDTNIFHILNPNFDMYEIDVYDSTTLKTERFKFVNIESLNDFILKTEKENYPLYKKILGEIYDDPELNLFTVYDESEEIEIEIEIDNNGKKEKFKFKNVKELNDYIIEMENTNPALSTKLKNQLDTNPEYKFIESENTKNDSIRYDKEIVVNNNGKKERFKFKNVKELNDFILKMENSNPALSTKLKNQLELNPDFKLIEIYDNSKNEITIEELNEICKNINISYEINSVQSDMSKYENVLNELSEKLNDSKYTITIIGHTCDLGTDNVNYKVGLNRAQTMKNILVEKGASTSKIKIKSDGSKHPLVENSSKENRKINRRVEFIIK